MIHLFLRLFYGIKVIRVSSKDVEGKTGSYLNSLLFPFTYTEYPESEVFLNCYFYKRVLIAIRKDYNITYDNGKVKTYRISEVGPSNKDILPNIKTENVWETLVNIIIITNANRKDINRRHKSLRLKTLVYLKEAGFGSEIL